MFDFSRHHFFGPEENKIQISPPRAAYAAVEEKMFSRSIICRKWYTMSDLKNNSHAECVLCVMSCEASIQETGGLNDPL